MMTERMISIMARIMLMLVITVGFLVPKAAAQSDKYSTMAPVEQYLMERNAEILLARSAAPDSISSDATILVLGRQGYETAVRGKNGFVCMVERSASGLASFCRFLLVLIVEGTSQAKGLPPILVFAVEVAKWSDGTAAPMHEE